MELTARRGERSADERCPYCHDALAAPAEDLVACPGCATEHHRSCVEELGRCTIRGCERPLSAAPEADEHAGRARRASVTEEIRRRLRERVRHYVSEHVAPVPDGPPHVRVEPAPAQGGPSVPVGRVLTEAEAHAREEVPPPRPRDPAFASLLREAQIAAREAPLAERAGHCRRVAELLRRPEAFAEVEHPEAVAHNYELRAAELEALAAHGARAGPGLSADGVVAVVVIALTALGVLTYVLAGR